MIRCCKSTVVQQLYGIGKGMLKVIKSHCIPRNLLLSIKWNLAITDKEGYMIVSKGF